MQVGDETRTIGENGGGRTNQLRVVCLETPRASGWIWSGGETDTSPPIAMTSPRQRVLGGREYCSGSLYWCARSQRTPLGGKRGARSAYLADHVLTAVGVSDAQCALRIILPFAVHDEAVVVLAGRQSHRRHPDSVFAFLHWDAALLPVSEITDQQDAHGCGCGETKRLLCGSLHLPCHRSLSFPELTILVGQSWPYLRTPLPPGLTRGVQSTSSQQYVRSTPYIVVSGWAHVE